MENVQKKEGLRFCYRVELDTLADIRDFVATACKCKGKVLLCSGKSFQINAQSMLGVILAKKLNWNDLMLVTEEDYWSEFSRFIAD